MDTTTVLTHLLAFLAGGVSWFLFTVWEGRRVTSAPDPSPHQETAVHPELNDLQDQPQEPPHGRLSRVVRSGPPTLGAVLLVVSAFVIALGLQQVQFQHQADERAQERAVTAAQDKRDAAARDLCYERWGRKLIRSTNARLQANRNEAAAEKRRDEALDNVLLIVIGLRATPPTAVDADFDRTLAAFASAKANLQMVERQATRTRTRNKPPQLRCTRATEANPRPARPSATPTTTPSGR